MKISVIYFAGLREKAGIASEEIETSGATLGDLYEQLRERHQFSHRLEHIKFARQNDFCRSSEPISQGDSILIMPPVSGG